eukprot:506242_1
MDLLLQFMQTLFEVTFRDLESFVYWVFMRSNHAQSGKLTNSQQWIEAFGEVSSEFYSSLRIQETMTTLRNTFVSNETSYIDARKQIKALENKFDHVLIFIHTFSIAHHFYEYISRQKAGDVPQEISIVLLRTDWMRYEPLVDCLKNILSETNTEIIMRYDVSADSNESETNFIIAKSAFPREEVKEGCGHRRGCTQRRQND